MLGNTFMPIFKVIMHVIIRVAYLKIFSVIMKM